MVDLSELSPSSGLLTAMRLPSWLDHDGVLGGLHPWGSMCHVTADDKDACKAECAAKGLYGIASAHAGWVGGHLGCWVDCDCGSIPWP